MKKLYEELSIRSIANAIRAKNGSTDSYKVGEMANAIDLLGLLTLKEFKPFNPPRGEVSAVLPGIWLKPEEWPDILSLPLPTDGTNCIYFLIDNTLPYNSFNYIYFRFEGIGSHTVDIGHILNELFVSDLNYAYSDSCYTNQILLTKDYPDYVIVKCCSDKATMIRKAKSLSVSASDSPTGFAIAATGTDSMRNIWVYGTIPTVTSLAGQENNSPSIGGRMVRRIKLLNCDNVRAWQYAFQNGYSTLSILLESNNNVSAGNMASTFQNCARVEEINLSKFDVSNCTSFSGTFSGCYALKTAHMENWNITNKATTFYGFFQNCKSMDFDGINFNNWNTSKVTSMQNMFYYCCYAKSIDISQWDMNLVTNSSGMFTSCKNMQLIKMPLSKYSKLTNTNNMFSSCVNLKGTIDMSNMNPSSWNISYGMFQYCYCLLKIKLGSAKLIVKSTSTSGAGSISNMFGDCWSLKSIEWNMTECDFSICGNLNGFYSNCYNLLGTIDWSWYGGSANVTSFTPWVNCYYVELIKLSDDIQLPKCTTLAKLFSGCRSLKQIDCSMIHAGTITSVANMFDYCYNVELIIMPVIDFSNVTTINAIFSFCTKLKSLPLAMKNINLIKCTDIAYTFRGCSNIEDIDISGWTNLKPTTMNGFLSEAARITKLNFSNINTSILTGSHSNVIVGTSLVSVNLSNWIQNLSFTTVNQSSIIEFYPPKMNVSFTINTMYSLDDASLQRIVDCLQTTSTTKTITMGSVKNKFSSDQIAAILAKGWTIA